MMKIWNRIKTFLLRKSIVKKISLGAILPLTMFSLIFSSVLYYESMNIINQRVIPSFEELLESNMRSFKAQLTPELINKAKTDKQAYEKLLEIANKIHKESDVQYVYIMSKVDGKGVILVLNDAEDYLTPLDFNPEQEATLSQPDKISFSNIYEDDYGFHKSVYYSLPGTDSMLGIDMDAKFVEDLKQRVVNISIGLSLLFILTGTIISILVSRRIAKPLIYLVKHTKLVADGDLTQEIAVKGKDEIGQLMTHFNHMVGQLKQMIKQIKGTAEIVDASSEEVASKTRHSSEIINESAAAIQEIAAGNEMLNRVMNENSRAIQEMAIGMQNINESIQESSEESHTTAKEAEQGEHIIINANKQMEDVSRSVIHSATLVRQMNERSLEINKVIDMIKEIAGQINLLSLNAAIEAARAGEHGKGFAVVSTEIRKLAEQTTAFSDEIFTTIHSIQQDTERSAEAMEVVTNAVQSGTHSVQEAGKAFGMIRGLTASVSEKFEAISSVTEQISAMVEEISANSDNITDIADKSDKNSKGMAAASQEQLAILEETTQSTEHLREQAAQLNDIIKQFKL
jgi:methyl-accepting chemotaxis protein